MRLTAKSGKTAPNTLRMIVFAAIAEAANIKYESIVVSLSAHWNFVIRHSLPIM
jgi:hypothetical protein